MLKKGLFITVEGVDGAGKSTAMEWLYEKIAAQYITVCTREPGGTILGERLRELLLNEPMDLETETSLMFAARREHIAQVIAPSLARGKVVISDRFTDATFAYQGGGRGVGFDKVLILEDWVQSGLQPDLTLLFDVPLGIARARITARSEGNFGALDRFENESFEFFRRTREAYLKRAKDAPQRIAIIDSTQSLDEVKQQISHVMMQRLHLNINIGGI